MDKSSTGSVFWAYDLLKFGIPPEFTPYDNAEGKTVDK